MGSLPETVVVLLVRTPVPGRVKTRLAAAIGGEEAYCLYRAMVGDILSNIKGCGLPVALFHDGPADGALPQPWLDAAVAVRLQRGADIGERMAAAFADCFAAGSTQVILAGSDIPDLDAGRVLKARIALATHDAALAPAVDGGYGLIALKRERYRPELFCDVPWSTRQVLPVTLQRFAHCGLDVHLLPVLRDIDTLADLLAYGQNPCPAATATNQTIAQLLTKTDPP